MSKEVIILEVKRGELVNYITLDNLISVLQDGKYFAEISSANKRSNPQNRYYWGLVVPIIQKGIKDLGTELTKEETHEFLKARFNLSDLVNPDTGEVINIPVSTTRLNKEQFAEYIGKIQQFAAEWLKIEIPDPGTKLKLFEDASTR